MSITCCYNGRPIQYERGVISSNHNAELYHAICDYLWQHGYEWGGGSVELTAGGTRVNLSVQTPAATGVQEMGPFMKRVFGFKELYLDAHSVN